MDKEIVRCIYERKKQRVGVMPTRREEHSSRKVLVNREREQIADEELDEFFEEYDQFESYRKGW